MYEFIFLWILSLIFVSLAVIQDLRTREIDNWISFSLIIFALGFRFFYFIFEENFSFFLSGLIGFGVFFILGNVFYYSKIFAGGDAKLMIAFGTILAPIELSSIFSSFFSFILIFLTVGFLYTSATSFYLCIKHFSQFKKSFSKILKKEKKRICFIIFVSLCFAFIGLFNLFFLFFGILIFVATYLYLYSKAVDEACMIKQISSKNLREGDWLYSDLKAGKKIVKAKWEGISKREISEIAKRFRHVKIREGIPFSPVFLISLVIFITLQILNINLWELLW